MKQTVFTRLLAVLLLVAMLLCSLAACNDDEGNDKDDKKDEKVTEKNAEHVDYVSELKLDMDSDSVKQEASVHIYIDGDTTHFKVPTSVVPEGILKARYISINTPESTGRIEPWGKKASNFTREKLSEATSIILESDNGVWNADSTGGRYLVWVWYKTAEMDEYRNLNLEILQNGLAIASNSNQNRYGEICMKAIDQAKNEKLYVYSTEKDPDFHYGAAQEITLKELRTNIKSYNGTKVAFEGVISAIYDGSFYVEALDEETKTYQGISVYYETAGLPGVAMENIATGNLVRVVGSVTYFEPGDIWQVSGITYAPRKPDDPSNFKLISKGHTPAYTLTSAVDFATKKVNVTVMDGETETEKSVDYAEMVLDTSISMKGLTVTKAKVNKNNEITLTCTSEGATISVFLGAMKDAEGNAITTDTFSGKTIDVKGIVDKYYENYQIRVLTVDDITVN